MRVIRIAPLVAALITACSSAGAGPAPEEGSPVWVEIHPHVLVTTNLDVYVKSVLGPIHTPTGPQVIRVRHARTAAGAPQPLEGKVTATEDGPVLETTARVYMDAPYMNLPLGLSHNLHSYPATITVRGPLAYLADGRMQARLTNTEAVPIDVEIGGGLLSVGLDLEIPEGGLTLTYTQRPFRE